MEYFIVKTNDDEIVSLFQSGTDEITLSGINSYEDSFVAGLPLFLLFGGDGVPWDKGLVALCKTLSGPIDKGYDASSAKSLKYYKIKFKIVARLPRTLFKSDFIPYKKAYDSYIGPSTKGERNQALNKITDEQAIAIIRAILDYFPSLDTDLANVIPEDIMAKAKERMEILVPKNLVFGETAVCQNNEAYNTEIVGENLLFYGVPGCGKSYFIQREYCLDDDHMERVVFHPDYSYSDFVGQILPRINSELSLLEYSFSAGPFTRILDKACDNPDEMFYLIIEELNRGNAPAIFGDIFQLLDRNESGESMYGITNLDISNAVYVNNSFKKIKIPNNLTIIATMNTSDQSVFALDTAFKRRWKMKQIPNRIEVAPFAHNCILGSDVTWFDFAETINNVITSEDFASSSSEDKRLGAFFVSQNDIELLDRNGVLEYNPAFAEKVLMYLWNDVFKYSRNSIFKSEFNTLESLTEAFETEYFEVFNIEFPQNSASSIALNEDTENE
ncbi:McrB family protein [Anaerosporobacter sp.]|uniref:McrB family protein n=1 Tax=Anaerosporobacter sp. TaxID=1872529 RepID=UPI00286FA0F1|nr:AAA family ATPase [Anaerosporobacter sp.]